LNISSVTTEAEAEQSELITVRACKYDGSLHREWQAELIERGPELLVLDGRFAEEVRHPLLGTLKRGTISIEYYWLDHWYNVFRFLEPTGELRNYYCNVNQPPSFDGQVLSYKDLDIDIMVTPSLSYTILDEDEFEANAARFNYPPEVRQRARQARDELVHLIESRQFPFNIQRDVRF
jgi:protein associated with RNAse G/E